MTQLKYKVGDVVLLNAYTMHLVKISHLHSGHYDWEYTGTTADGGIVYFNGEDVYEDC